MAREGAKHHKMEVLKIVNQISNTTYSPESVYIGLYPLFLVSYFHSPILKLITSNPLKIYLLIQYTPFVTFCYTILRELLKKITLFIHCLKREGTPQCLNLFPYFCGLGSFHLVHPI